MAGVAPLDIYKALIGVGFSSIQAEGIMGNMIAESSLDPEVDVVDSNGARSYGLCSWNAASYPNAGSLVTGNPAADMARQVSFLRSTASGMAITGSTAEDVAGNFAAYYEVCSTCSVGNTGTNGWSTRRGYAAEVAGWAASGHWPAASGSGGGGAAPVGTPSVSDWSTLVAQAAASTQARAKSYANTAAAVAALRGKYPVPVVTVPNPVTVVQPVRRVRG